MQSGLHSRSLGRSGRAFRALLLLEPDKFPRFLAWQDNFRGLEVTAVPFACPPPPLYPLSPPAAPLKSTKRGSCAHSCWASALLFVGRALGSRIFLQRHVQGSEPEGGADWHFRPLHLLQPTPEWPLPLAILAPHEEL